nr:glycosyltransferase [uncultured Pedobacter sp.]
MNFLIVTHYFPPLNEIASLRLYAIAKYLAVDGHNVYVVTSEKNIADGDLSLVKRLPDSVIVKVVKYKSIASIYSRFKGKQPNKQVVDKEELLQRPNKSKIKMFFANKVYALGSLLDFQFFWRSPATKVCSEIIIEKKIDIVISSFSPISSFIIGARLKKRFSYLKWVADYRDLCSLNNVSAAKGFFNKIERRLEINTVGQYGDLITVVSDPLKESLQSLFPNKKIIVVENGFDEEDYDMSILGNKKVSPIKETINIVHTGTIYPVNRDPSPLFLALNQLKEEGKITESDFRITFYGNKLGDLNQIIQECDAENWIALGGQVDHEKSLQVQRECDLLLFLEGNNEKSKGVLTGKLFEYFMSNVPILGIGITPETSAGELILKSQTGFVLGNNIEDIKETLLYILSNRGKNYFTPDFDIINKYSRRLLNKKLISGINKL